MKNLSFFILFITIYYIVTIDEGEAKTTKRPELTTIGQVDDDGFAVVKSKKTIQQENTVIKSRPASTTSLPPTMPTKYYRLAAAWPAALNSAWNGYQSWTIHGLWPEKNNRQLQNCPTTISDDDLRIALNKLVDKATSNNNLDKWQNAMGNPIQTRPQLIGHLEHQWKKHGSCHQENPTIRSVKEYFQTTANLIQELNIKQNFMNNFFAPGAYKYDLDVFNLVKSIWGVKTIIQCETSTENPCLSEIQFCYTTSWSLIDCAPFSSGSYISPRCIKKKNKTNQAMQLSYSH